MAAPSATVRQDPSGLKLKDGYRALVTFAADPDFSIWEMDVGIPGLDGGEKIPQTTMHNDTVRTYAPRALIDLTDSTVRFAYDPNCINNALSLINVETTITKRFSDTSTLAYYGFLKGLEFDPLVEGTPPTGTATIVATNVDPNTGGEELPVLTSAVGT